MNLLKRAVPRVVAIVFLGLPVGAYFVGAWEAVTGVGTLLLAIVALFADPVRRYFRPPDIEIGLKSESGELTWVLVGQDQVTGEPKRRPARYYHLSVRNNGSIVHNAAVYLTKIERQGAAEQWVDTKAGEVPLRWRLSEIYPLWREIGVSAVDADLCALIKEKWLELTPVVAPNNFPRDEPLQPGHENDPPGRFRRAVKLRVTVQVKASDGESIPYVFEIHWSGGWRDGSSEILQEMKILPKKPAA